MSFTREDVAKVAHLARLAVYKNTSDTLEAQSMDPFMEHVEQDLNNILSLISQINETETSNLVPMAHPFAMKQRLREDLVTEPNSRDKLLAISPNSDAGLYLVPKVID